MKVEWMRTRENIIRKMDYINDYDYLVVKVADTPQELIQVGDLVEDEIGTIFNIRHIEMFIYDNITKIYTPNKDKTQYTLQWKRGES